MAISHASLLQVFELEQPVEDQYGYIYEHQAIRATLANHAQRGQPCSCPIAGSFASALSATRPRVAARDADVCALRKKHAYLLDCFPGDSSMEQPYLQQASVQAERGCARQVQLRASRQGSLTSKLASASPWPLDYGPCTGSVVPVLPIASLQHTSAPLSAWSTQARLQAYSFKSTHFLVLLQGGNRVSLLPDCRYRPPHHCGRPPALGAHQACKEARYAAAWHTGGQHPAARK
eukprot:1146132-Pelagomonas_calceolata.AAC.2